MARPSLAVSLEPLWLGDAQAEPAPGVGGPAAPPDPPSAPLLPGACRERLAGRWGRALIPAGLFPALTLMPGLAGAQPSLGDPHTPLPGPSLCRGSSCLPRHPRVRTRLLSVIVLIDIAQSLPSESGRWPGQAYRPSEGMPSLPGDAVSVPQWGRT